MSSPQTSPTLRDASIILPPAQFAAPLLQVSTQEQTVLPFELVDLLNQVYFLHILANEPRKVLPPGKSLLSVFSGVNVDQTDGQSDAVKSRVQGIVHRAFWDEVLFSCTRIYSPFLTLQRRSSHCRILLLHHNFLG